MLSARTQHGVDARDKPGHDAQRGLSMNRIVPLLTVLAALFVVWYVAAVLMNAPLQRDLFANNDNKTYTTADLMSASLNMERPKLPAPHQVAASLYTARHRHPADLQAQPRLSRRHHAGGDADRLRHRRAARRRRWRC